MKKALSLLLALASLLCLASCTATAPATTTIANTTAVTEAPAPETVTDKLNAMAGQLTSLEAIEEAKSLAW